MWTMALKMRMNTIMNSCDAKRDGTLVIMLWMNSICINKQGWV